MKFCDDRCSEAISRFHPWGFFFLLNLCVLCFPSEAEVCFPPLYHLLYISVDFQNIRCPRNLKLEILEFFCVQSSDEDPKVDPHVQLLVAIAVWTLITTAQLHSMYFGLTVSGILELFL